MKKYVHLTLVLFIISALSGLILGIVNNLTKEPIAIAEAKKLANGIENIFPNLDSDSLEEEENTIILNEKILKEYYIIYDDKNQEQIIGYVFYVIAPKPYQKLEFIVGITVSGKVKGISYLISEETPGVGTKVNEISYISRFLGLNDVAEVDTLTGATKSSTAVKNGVKAALDYFNENIKELGDNQNEN